MFTWLADGIVRRPWIVLVSWVLIVVVALSGTFSGFGGKSLMERLHSGSVTVPGTESAEVADLTTTSTSRGTSITLVVSGVDLKDQATLAKLMPVVTQHRTSIDDLPHTATVLDLFSFQQGDPRAQAFASKDADGFVMVTTLDHGLDTDTQEAAEKTVREEYQQLGDAVAREVPGASATPLSQKIMSGAIIAQTERDLIRGETVGLPIALLLMVLVFGGAIAASLPLIGALAAIVIGMFGLWLFTHVMTMDSFILNVISLIGLALSIDYGLLVVSRFREEAHLLLTKRGHTPDDLPNAATRKEISLEAVRTASVTAGRTVSFSALTIAFAVAGLLVMKSSILQAIGIGGVMVVIIAVLTSATLIPALLALFGHKLLAPSPLTRIPGLHALFRAVGDVSTEHGVFSRLASWVHRHPWGVMLGTLALLAVMATPIGSLSLRNYFPEYIPRDTPAKAAYTVLQDDYPALAQPEIVVVVDRAPGEAGADVEHLQGLDKVTYVSMPQAVPDQPDRSVLNVRMDVDDPVGADVVSTIRQLRDWDPGHRVLVGGLAAGQIDFTHSIVERAPLALGIMAFAVFALLFLMTGSLLVPLKALIINTLSLVASLGATWFIFDHGLLGLPNVRGMETFVVACALAFGFGLAMDYEVFLLARIKEYWDAGKDNDTAVEMGLQRSGRIITSAAAIMFAVFAGFIAGELLAIKEIGVTLALVVFVDATLVRMLLVPATMTLLGKWNWWAPRWLQGIYERFKLVH